MSTTENKKLYSDGFHLHIFLLDNIHSRLIMKQFDFENARSKEYDNFLKEMHLVVYPFIYVTTRTISAIGLSII